MFLVLWTINLFGHGQSDINSDLFKSYGNICPSDIQSAVHNGINRS